MNLSGEYHPADEPMSVIAIETLTEIPFTKEALKNHPTTMEAYQYNGTYYKALVRKYPKQSELIRGIINPVDIDLVINSPDFTILQYDPSLVEVQESNLIQELQTWIYNHIDRWHNSDYQLADSLYPAAVLGILFANIPSAILNIRLDNCGTNRAHSFHIWSFLGSHGELDRYKGDLTIKQALYLYRNIRYIAQNNEKTSTFNELVDNLLTSGGFPLYAFDIVHNLRPYPKALSPDVEMERYPITLKGAATNGQTAYSVSEILNKERKLFAKNIDSYQEVLADIEHRMRTAQVNRVKTKVLETELRGSSDNIAINIESVRLNHWYLLSANNRYVGRVNITNPLTGQYNQLTPAEALILYTYCVWSASGIRLKYIPNMLAVDVLRLALPTLDQLRSITDKRLISTQEIADFRKGFLTLDSYNTPEAFIEACDKIIAYVSKLKSERDVINELHRQATMEVMHSTATQTVTCQLKPPNTEYSRWLLEKNIPAISLTPEESALYASRILKEMIGIGSANKSTLKRLESMVKITTQLSHYDLKILVSDSGVDVPSAPFKNLKVGDSLTTFNPKPLQHKTTNDWHTTGRNTHSNSVTHDMHKTMVRSANTYRAPTAYWSVQPVIQGVQWSVGRVKVNVNHTRFHAVDQGA